MRIGKCECGSEFVATAIQMDNITEVTCKGCGKVRDTNIIPKQKKEIIEEFKRALDR